MNTWKDELPPELPRASLAGRLAGGLRLFVMVVLTLVAVLLFLIGRAPLSGLVVRALAVRVEAQRSAAAARTSSSGIPPRHCPMRVPSGVANMPAG